MIGNNSSSKWYSRKLKFCQVIENNITLPKVIKGVFYDFPQIFRAKLNENK